MSHKNRPLTNDERKAAEAAFKGEPFDPKWSDAARKVFLGLSSAIANKRNEAFEEIRSAQPTTHAKQTLTAPKDRRRAKSTLW